LRLSSQHGAGSEPGCTVLLDSSGGTVADPLRKSQQNFILDAGKVTYVFGINQQSMLQHIYWAACGREEDFATPSTKEWSAFDLSTTTTPQEYPGWGAGLYVEPSLKVTFPDGIGILFCITWRTR